MSLERPFVDEALVRDVWERTSAVAGECAEVERDAADASDGLRALVTRLGARGLLGLVAEQRDGGTFEAVRSTALCVARERLGHVSPLVDLAFAMQGLGSYPITLAGNAESRARFLPEVVAGRAIAAFALTEPNAGSDLDGIATRAVRDGDRYVLDGHKMFISNAGLAHFYSVFAVTDPSGGKRRLSAFVVPADAPGVEIRPQRVLGGHPIGEVFLRGTTIPASYRLGEEGGGLGVALGTLARFRPTVGAAALGFAQRALDEAVAHVRTRVQFGKPLAEQQATQLALADMAVDVEASRMLVYRAAAAADGTHPRELVSHTASTGKLFATEAAFRVIDRAVQLLGGRGVLADNIVARLYEDVRSLRIYEGTTEVQKLLIARTVLARGER